MDAKILQQIKEDLLNRKAGIAKELANFSTKTDAEKEKDKGVLTTAWRRLLPLMAEEKRSVVIAIAAMFVSSAVTLVVPIIIARIVDNYIAKKDFSGVLSLSGMLFSIFLEERL